MEEFFLLTSLCPVPTIECVFHSRKGSFCSGSYYQPHNLQAMNKRTFEREQIMCKPPKTYVKN